MAVNLADIKYCITCGHYRNDSTTDQGFSCCEVIWSNTDDCRAKLNCYSMSGQMEYCYACGRHVTIDEDAVYCNGCLETVTFNPKMSIKRFDIHYCPLCSNQLSQLKSILNCMNCTFRIPFSDDNAAEHRLVEYSVQGKVKFCYTCGCAATSAYGVFVKCSKKDCFSTLPMKARVSKTSSLKTNKQPAERSPDASMCEAKQSLTSITEEQSQLSLAQKLKSAYPKISEDTDSLAVYKILTYPLDMMRDQKVKRVGVCEKVSYPAIKHKVFMILGETGAGKTTLINFLANFLLDVKWEDPFRFVLVPDGRDQTKSQTQSITAYTFHYVSGSKVRCNFTVIDTPGFGDTKGIETDKRIVDQINEFFTLPSPFGIDCLDGIALVVKAHDKRLTPMQKYVFSSVVSLFGIDMKRNIFITITHVDDSTPTVINALQACDIPANNDMTFEFNNSALLLNEEKRKPYSVLYWNMGVKSAKALFSKLMAAESVSLTLTKEVLTERRQLEANIQGMQEIILQGMAHISVIKQERKILHEYQESAEQSKNYTYVVDVPKHQVSKLEPGEYVTNCLLCNFTCHRDCKIPDSGEKYKCIAMKPQERDCALCTICPNKCQWDVHKNNDFRYEIHIEQETRNYEDLKKRYEESIKGKFNKEALLKKLTDEKHRFENEVLRLIKNAYESIQKLEKIALKQNPLSEVEYIGLLIEAEKRECRPGWLERINQYERAKQAAILLKGIKDQTISIHDYLKQLKLVDEEDFYGENYVPNQECAIL